MNKIYQKLSMAALSAAMVAAPAISMILPQRRQTVLFRKIIRKRHLRQMEQKMLTRRKNWKITKSKACSLAIRKSETSVQRL